MNKWFDVPAFRHATAALVGTMVGVGIFGVPFVFAKTGFLIGVLWLFGIAAVMTLFYLMFAELMLRTEGDHQLVGYADRWLGAWGKRVVAFALIVGIYGALLAYTIVVGPFMHHVFSNFVTIDPAFYSIIFTALLAPLILARLTTVSFIEQGLTVLFIAVVATIAIGSFGHIDASNYSFSFPRYWFLPYGVILFAFSGATSMPIVRRLMRGREHGIKPAVFSAVALVGLLYLVFAAVVVGVSGQITSPDSLSGLFDFIGMPIVVLGSVFGILTIATSYLMLGTAMFEILHLDYRVRKPVAWPLVVFPPLILYFSGLRNFIDVIGTIGAVTVGLTSIVFILAYVKARKNSERMPEVTLHVPVVVWYFLVVVFAAGIGYAVLWQ